MSIAQDLSLSGSVRKTSVSGSLNQGPLKPLVQDLCLRTFASVSLVKVVCTRISASASLGTTHQDSFKAVVRAFVPGSCRTFCLWSHLCKISVYYVCIRNNLCKISVPGSLHEDFFWSTCISILSDHLCKTPVSGPARGSCGGTWERISNKNNFTSIPRDQQEMVAWEVTKTQFYWIPTKQKSCTSGPAGS